MRIVAQVRSGALQQTVTDAAAGMGADLTMIGANGRAPEHNATALQHALRSHPEVLLVDVGADGDLAALLAEARARGVAVVAVCATEPEAELAARVGVDEWVMTPTSPAELAARVRAALLRSREAQRPAVTARLAEHLRYEELLYDRFTGFPTLPVMLERGREILESAGRLTILYIQFIRYSKLEEIYGWQKLDEVLQTTANAVRSFYDREHEGGEEGLFMVSHTGDDNFILFSDLRVPPAEMEQRINEVAEALERQIRERLDAEHGEDVAGLFEIYIGATTLFRNPKLRTSRMIYRGIREAALVARSVEHRERSRKIADLKETLREGAVYIEYHPIVVTETAEVYGYEALARGTKRALRSPEVLFGVAEEANLIWELSRLCRRRAIEGIATNLAPDQLLFINIDPYDFRDPTFRYLDADELGIEQPERIVLEITERTAITDYPKFQGYLQEFRERGFRFAVDDAGSGYAGLGSIANLAPDFIKLDISLISGIDANFMKQNLVETMVSFANEHGIQVIAEGVEREEEWETVKQLGVHLTQGFLFHKPRYEGRAAS
ncbi:MAG TPA: EAL domain-containing protein [Longimicrobiaceae bacterium]|nr:EAL domain-containing protein [Longimicrobiaceae bacterium]